jgi:hypothetical protein
LGSRDGCLLAYIPDVVCADLTRRLPSCQQPLNLRVFKNRSWQCEGPAGRHKLPLVGVMSGRRENIDRRTAVVHCVTCHRKPKSSHGRPPTLNSPVAGLFLLHVRTHPSECLGIDHIGHRLEHTCLAERPRADLAVGRSAACPEGLRRSATSGGRNPANQTQFHNSRPDSASFHSRSARPPVCLDYWRRHRSANWSGFTVAMAAGSGVPNGPGS